MEGILDRKMTKHQPGSPCISGWVLDAFGEESRRHSHCCVTLSVLIFFFNY